MSQRLHDLALATLGAGLALGASALVSAAPAAPAPALDAPPEMRTGMDVVPISPDDAKPPAGQVRQVVGSWVLIKTKSDEFWWVNFDQVLLYQSDRR